MCHFIIVQNHGDECSNNNEQLMQLILLDYIFLHKQLREIEENDTPNGSL